MTQIPFDNFQISGELKRAIHDMGFQNATEIQAKSIPLILEGKDIIGRSQTGTGKTAAFGIPAIELTDAGNKKDIQVLIVCPTRELAMQSWGEFKKLYKYKSGVKAAAVYGGQYIGRQIMELRRGVNIVIGTPGRIMDHMRRKTLKLDHVKMVVLDEADEMLNMGFREDIETILKQTPQDRQTLLFSATMPPAILAITKHYQHEPQMVAVNEKQVTLSAIEQYYCETPSFRKKEALMQLLMLHKPEISIVFCNTQKMVDELCEFLNENGYKAAGLHGGMKQNARTQVMSRFKCGMVKMLVATDVAARGIDVHNIDTVINYDIPLDPEFYVHRIGRTGRAGKAGKAYTIVCGRHQQMQLRELEHIAKTKMTFENVALAGPVPGLVVSNRPIKALNLKSGEDLDSRPAKVSLGSRYTLPHEDCSKIEINIGREQNIAPNHVVGAIVENTTLSGHDIGKINIYRDMTVVEIPQGREQQVIEEMKGCKINGHMAEVKPYIEQHTGRRLPRSTHSRSRKQSFSGSKRFH